MSITPVHSNHRTPAASTANAAWGDRRSPSQQVNWLRGPVAVAIFIAAIASAIFVGPGRAAAVPPEFDDTLVTNVSGPTELAWTPDGRMLVTGKTGQLRVYTNGQLLSTPAIDLTSVICSNGERGLVGLAVHPNFALNHFIYLFYTYNKFANLCPESEIDGPVDRLSRFVLGDNNVVDPQSEFVLFETPPMYRNHHTGGDVKFGKDGLIYITLGDEGAQALGWPQDLGKLAGKVVRVTDTGGIPPGNPYTGAGTARCNIGGVPPAGSPAGTKCQEVFSAGLRNPFRQAHDPNAAGVRYYINDVGQHTWEEISEGPIAGGNYGWPVREGPCAKDADTNCGPSPAGMTDPTHWYHHGPDGGAATAGAFVPNGIWPDSFTGSYLFADYVFGEIYQLRPGGTRCLTCAPPTSGMVQSLFTAANQVVSMRFGPYGGTQALYYISRDGSTVRRIAFTGSANRAPVAVISATPTYGALPLAVQFDGTGSTDPDGDALTYSWDFQDDGIVDSTQATPSFSYLSAGAFTARLTVRDPAGASNSTTITINPGNTPPVVTIDTPTASTTFAVGDQLILHGTATDPQSGPLPSSSLTWEVLRHHATHTHPHLEPTAGNDITISAPEPEDLDAARTSYLEIRLTATDPDGLSATVTRNIDPTRVDITFATDPPGLHLVVSGDTLTGPQTVTSWQAFAMNANAPDQIDGSGRLWVFDNWSDGGSRTHAITTPATPTTYTATFVEATPPPPTSFTFNSVADTYVSAAEPDRNFGTRSTIRTDASPDLVSYLRFNITGLGGTVTGAKLRILPGSSNNIGINVRSANSGAWIETTLTYNNQPGLGGVIGSSGSLTMNTWVEIPIATQGIANGALNIGLSSTSTTATSLSSREAGANAPQLIVTTSGGLPSDTTPPSTPTDLAATAVSSGRVDLTWTTSTDNIGVTGYDIFRDGAPLISIGNITTHSDLTVAAGRTYSYQVRARDAAGNLSGLSIAAQATTPPSGGTISLMPTDDASIKFDSPTTNFGGASTLEVDNSPVKHFLLRFDLSSVNGPIVGAKLRLFVVDSSSTGGNVCRSATTAWNQGSVTWNTAPAIDNSVAAVAMPAVTAGTMVEVDVLTLINGGVLTLRLTSPSSNGADYSSKEGSTPPQLVITTG